MPIQIPLLFLIQRTGESIQKILNEPLIEVSGVRNSCDTWDRNCDAAGRPAPAPRALTNFQFQSDVPFFDLLIGRALSSAMAT